MRFILRHDTFQNWQEKDPVLMKAELVLIEEEDNVYSLALGDGVHPFTQLPRITLQEGLSAKIVLDFKGRFALKLEKEERSEVVSDNYMVINGKKVEFTAEQMAALGIEVKKKNPFERVECGGAYYYVDNLSKISTMEDDYMHFNLCHFDNANYFNDKDFALWVNLQQLLYRKLLKYAYDTGTIDDQPWNGKTIHYTIDYDIIKGKCYIGERWTTWDPCRVYFKEQRAVLKAFDSVVVPFFKSYPEIIRGFTDVSKN